MRTAVGYAALRTLEAANRFLREDYITEFNRRFQVAPRQRGNAFVPCRSHDLERIFSLQFERQVNRDNTVSFQNLSLQLERVFWRATLAGCAVTVHQHLDATLSITHGPHVLGRYTAEGAAQVTTKNGVATGCGKDARWKSHKPDFPTSLGNPANGAGFPLSHSPDGCWLNVKTGHVMCYKNRTF